MPIRPLGGGEPRSGGGGLNRQARDSAQPLSRLVLASPPSVSLREPPPPVGEIIGVLALPVFAATDTADSPWTVIKSDDKKRARLNAMRFVLDALPYKDKDPERIGAVDARIVGPASLIHERGEKG